MQPSGIVRATIEAVSVSASEKPTFRPQTFGKYTLLAPIATGGMGELFLARLRTAESGFERLVVIKRILPHLTDKDEFVNMFLDEARVAAQIHHSNVCQILELGQVDGRYYMALEYLEGVSMTQVIIGRRDCSELAGLRLLISIMTQACEGLHFAHNVRTPDGALAGVVHRDVNPKNIFVTSAGVTKVLDFGIVKAKDALNVTRTGSVKGTYSYMSPEQIKAQPVDRRSDIFSLGIVTWEALTGVRLFKRENDFHTWQAITEEDAPPPSEFRDGIPEALDRAILRALAREREQRWPTAREFAVALEEAVGSGSLTPVAMASAIETAFEGELEQQRARARIDGSGDEMVIDDWGVPTTVDTSVTPSAQRQVEAELQVGISGTVGESSSYTAPSRTEISSGRRTGVMLAVGMIAAIFTLAAVLFVTRHKPDRAAAGVQDKTDGAGAADLDTAPPAPDAAAAVPAILVDARQPRERSRDAAVAVSPDAAPPRADAAVAAIAIDAAPRENDRDERDPDERDRDERTERREFGTLTVNAKPYGTVFIDGRRVGLTPIVGYRLEAGRHRVKVVSSVDKTVKSFSVRIAPEKATRRMVRW